MVKMKFSENNEEMERKYPFEKLTKDLNHTSNFVLSYYDYINASRDYGTGDYLSMMEAHVLTDIVDNPGITVTELAKVWDRTTSAISQTVRKLMKKDYVYRVNSKTDAKIFYLHPNDSAVEFAIAHKEFDKHGMYRTRYNLLKKCSEEDIEIFYKVMVEYTKIIKDHFEQEQKSRMEK